MPRKSRALGGDEKMNKNPDEILCFKEENEVIYLARMIIETECPEGKQIKRVELEFKNQEELEIQIAEIKKFKKQHPDVKVSLYFDKIELKYKLEL